MAFKNDRKCITWEKKTAEQNKQTKKIPILIISYSQSNFSLQIFKNVYP